MATNAGPRGGYSQHCRDMSSKEFKELQKFIHSELGIRISTAKKGMLQARLQKRLRALGLDSFGKYKDYLFSLQGMDVEMPHFMNVVTTNTTEFFREAKHFEYLNNIVLPEWKLKPNNSRPFSVWSCACSSGEEPYTLAIVCSEFFNSGPRGPFEILATDISSNVLEMAGKAVYPDDKLGKVSLNLKRKYFLRSKDRKKSLVRVAPEIRKKVRFRQLNIMHNFNFRESFDVIFCRNMLIYFDRPNQEHILRKLCRQLKPGGYLFIGHSESLTGMKLPLRQMAPATYKSLD